MEPAQPRLGTTTEKGPSQLRWGHHNQAGASATKDASIAMGLQATGMAARDACIHVHACGGTAAQHGNTALLHLCGRHAAGVAACQDGTHETCMWRTCS
eukprot:366187-Chlamydomonas_euryale.AAC.7